MIYVLLGFLIFLLYRLFSRIILPVYLATRRMRKKFREFEQQQRGQQSQPPPQSPKPKREVNKDYIDFEEISLK